MEQEQIYRLGTRTRNYGTDISTLGDVPTASQIVRDQLEALMLDATECQDWEITSLSMEPIADVELTRGCRVEISIDPSLLRVCRGSEVGSERTFRVAVFRGDRMFAHGECQILRVA